MTDENLDKLKSTRLELDYIMELDKVMKSHPSLIKIGQSKVPVLMNAIEEVKNNLIKQQEGLNQDDDPQDSEDEYVPNKQDHEDNMLIID